MRAQIIELPSDAALLHHARVLPTAAQSPVLQPHAQQVIPAGARTATTAFPIPELPCVTHAAFQSLPSVCVKQMAVHSLPSASVAPHAPRASADAPAVQFVPPSLIPKPPHMTQEAAHSLPSVCVTQEAVYSPSCAPAAAHAAQASAGAVAEPSAVLCSIPEPPSMTQGSAHSLLVCAPAAARAAGAFGGKAARWAARANTGVLQCVAACCIVLQRAVRADTGMCDVLDHCMYCA